MTPAICDEPGAGDPEDDCEVNVHANLTWCRICAGSINLSSCPSLARL